MRKNTIILISLLTILAFIACNKDRKGIADVSVISWLKSQKSEYPKHADWIDELSADLDYSKKHTFPARDEETLTVIPLRTAPRRFTISKNYEINSTATALYILTEPDGNIRAGRIATIKSKREHGTLYNAELLLHMLQLTEDFKRDYKNFTGEVGVLRINQSFVSEMVYINGKVEQIKDVLSLPLPPMFQRNSLDHLNSIAPDWQVPGAGRCTDWYMVVYQVQTYIVRSITYQYTTCEGTGGGGGGSPGSNEVVFLENGNTSDQIRNAFICEDNVYFLPLTSGKTHYTANVNNVGITAVHFKPREIFEVNFPNTCLTIPAFLASTPAEASKIFSEAFNDAVYNVFRALNQGTIAERPSAVRSLLKGQIQSNLLQVNKGIAWSTGPCTGSGNYTFDLATDKC